MKGKQRAAITKAKALAQITPISAQVTEELQPYLKGMLKTIGQSGSGYKNRGKGDLKAAIGGVRLLLDAMGTGADNRLAELLLASIKGNDADIEEDDYFDDDDDTEIDEIIDSVN